MLKASLSAICLVIICVSGAQASVMPLHVSCEIQGEVLKEYETQHIDRFMGGEQKIKLHNVDVRIVESKYIEERGMGTCPEAGTTGTYQIQSKWGTFKFKKGECILAKTQKSGSTTFNGDWIELIRNLPVEKCAR